MPTKSNNRYFST